MRRAVLLIVAVLLPACAAGNGSAPTTVPAPTTTPVAVSSTIETIDCGAIPYEVGELPAKVVAESPDPEDVPQDVFTTVPGTVSRLWLNENGDLAVAFIRGSLPPVEWPGDRGEVSIDGTRGAAGQLEDGSWMIGWFEGDGERCDQFFMVFYAPVEASDVEATVASLNRTDD